MFRNSALICCVLVNISTYLSSEASFIGFCAKEVKQLNAHKPVVILTKQDNVYKLAEPVHTKSKSFVALGETAILTCPGRRNGLQLNETVNEIVVHCNTQITVPKFESEDWSNVTCKKIISGCEIPTDQTCANGRGRILRVGYKYDGQMIEGYQVCHESTTGRTFYAQHLLYGTHFPKRVGDRVIRGKRPHFQICHSDFTSPDSYYKMKNQRRILSPISEITLNSSTGQFFARGHLVPNGDYYLNFWRPMTFQYVNAQPQWQNINSGAWLQVEEEVRELAVEFQKTFEVWTGTSGILTLGSEETRIYLGPIGTLSVPMLFWKLIRDPQTKLCAGFIVNNFPLDVEPAKLCHWSCRENGWDVEFTKERGYAECCSYHDMSTIISEVPRGVECEGYLNRMNFKNPYYVEYETRRIGDDNNTPIYLKPFYYLY